MQIDELVLKLGAKISDAKSSISSMINLTKNLDNTTSKTAQSFDKISNNIEKVGESFKKPTKNIRDLENELKSLKIKYNEHIDIFKQWGSLATENMNFKATQSMSAEDIKKGEGSAITKESLTNELARIKELQQEIDRLREKSERQPSSSITDKLVPKNVDNKPLKDIGDKADKSSKQVKKLASSMASIGTISKVASKGFNALKNKFSDLTKNMNKGLSNNIKSFKKLALGLLGVRTVMSVLTKSVNAYLSFDSELQESISNSWNMLGSLLAPAIEFVAKLFAMATNYIAQFVNALSGIDLVARANAKALQTQAKANEKANKAQRGLLSMDEITNLPTENAGASVNQISMDDTIKSFKIFDKLLEDIRNKDWHVLGEDIASGIDDLLSSIDWEKIQKKAYNITYNFADFLNGLFEVDWSQLGSTLSEVVNTWIDFIGGFVDKFSFIQFGVGLGNALESFITNINWEELGQNLTKGLDGLFQGVIAFLETTDWSEIGEKIGDFIRNIDWGKLLSDLIMLLDALFEGLYKFIAGFIGSFYKDLSDDSKEKIVNIMDTVYDIIDGAIQSVVDLFTKPIEYISQIFKDLVSGIKLLFQGDLLNAFKKIGKSLINALILPLNIFILGFNEMLIPLRAIIVALGKATGKDWTMNDIKIPTIPTLSTGTPNIESEGLYHLHEGEMVVPKRYNPNTDGYDSGKDNQQIIDLLVSLNSNIIQYADRPVQVNMNGRQVASAMYDDFQEVSRNKNQSTVVVRS